MVYCAVGPSILGFIQMQSAPSPIRLYLESCPSKNVLRLEYCIQLLQKFWVTDCGRRGCRAGWNMHSFDECVAGRGGEVDMRISARSIQMTLYPV
jgi:hypothetical protein